MKVPRQSGSGVARKLGLALLALPVLAVANADVEKNIANSGNWAMQAGDMYNQRYSQLKQINTGNVGKMQVAWTFSTGVLRGHEGSPLVIDGLIDSRQAEIQAILKEYGVPLVDASYGAAPKN